MQCSGAYKKKIIFVNDLEWFICLANLFFCQIPFPFSPSSSSSSSYFPSLLLLLFLSPHLPFSIIPGSGVEYFFVESCAHATQFPALLVHRPVNDPSNFSAFWASQLLLLGKIEKTREDIWDLGLTPLMLNFGHLHAFDSPPPPSFDLYMFKNLDLTVWSYLCKRLSVSVFM